jgi:hypothetical protein
MGALRRKANTRGGNAAFSNDDPGRVSCQGPRSASLFHQGARLELPFVTKNSVAERSRFANTR